MSNTASHSRAEKLLLEAGRAFNSTLEYEELIERVLRLVVAAAGSQAALVFRVDHERTDIKIRFMNCVDCRVKVFRRELGQGVIGWVAKYKEPVIINDAAGDPKVDQEIGRLGGISMKSLISVPLIGKGQMIGVIEAINKLDDGEFDEADLDVLIGLANQIAVAIDNAYLYRAVKREALEKHLLYEIGKKLSGSLRLDEVLREILDSLKKAVDFDSAGIYLVDSDTRQIESVLTVGYDPEDEASQHLMVGQGLIGTVAQEGEAVIVPDVAADRRYIRSSPTTRSEIVAPIKLDDKAIGVINLESDRLDAFDRRARSLMSAFASQAAISIERARLHEQLIAGQKLVEQLSIAREIQRSFLPGRTPDIPGYDLAGRNVPSFQVGGDYYDFIDIVKGQTGIAIGDVSGKGIAAALIMASFRASLIAEIRNNYSIRAICHKVNNLLCESVRPGSFVTALYGVLDSRNHVLTFANCGHDQPILLRSDGRVEYLKEGGPLLGVTPDVDYEERPVYLNRGEVVLLYTDGVSEAFNSADEAFGTERLIQVLRDNRRESSQTISEVIFKAVKEHASRRHVFDDLTMIVLKRLD
ncbi:MAG: SpoIIE family protein phosphatase [candidate division Zixibacteria bacterium]|nr:SpoIIE family protein phosphatase [candidate division Zixibacteria bacterium]